MYTYYIYILIIYLYIFNIYIYTYYIFSYYIHIYIYIHRIFLKLVVKGPQMSHDLWRFVPSQCVCFAHVQCIDISDPWGSVHGDFLGILMGFYKPYYSDFSWDYHGNIWESWEYDI